MKRNRIFIYKFLSVIVLAALIFGAAAFIPTQTVAAASPAQQANPPTPDPQKVDARLKTIFQREKAALDRISDRLSRVDAVIDRVETWITKAGEKGLETSKVQAALQAFKNAIDQAKPFIETARGILNAHSGFDSQGNVTDRTLARQTAKDTASVLQGARQAMNGSLKALIDALKDLRQQYKQQNKP